MASTQPGSGPHGRHEAGCGPASGLWVGQDIQDRACWRAYRNGLLLTVTRRAHEHWIAIVECGDVIVGRSPVIATRLACQQWADNLADEKAAGENS